MKRIILFSLLIIAAIVSCKQDKQKEIIYSGNPILPGDFADPCILMYRDTFYIYATSGSEATVWHSANFLDWRLKKLNWPTEMGKPDIWAPSVRQGNDGRFYLYTSTSHNIYAGVAEHPEGPFKNILGDDSIFIKNRQWWDKMHSIDADCFIDDDGQAYLYWGSGFDFKDGICACGILGNDMASFKETPELITPAGYFEGPHMMKRQGKYYLMYSDGFFYDSTYKVRYAISNKPTGPFVEGKNSPILKSSQDGMISGPGHHYTINFDDNYYIVYHRHAQPLYAPYWGPIRQICIDKMNFDTDGSISRITATQEGVPLDFVKVKEHIIPLKPLKAEASSNLGESFSPGLAFDNKWGTLWAADKNELPVWLKADFGKKTTIHTCEPYFDRIMGDYEYKIEYSSDNKTWKLYAEGNNAQAEEWPVHHSMKVKARYIRLTILRQSQEPHRIGLWELKIY
jgi:arabinoxylan arabinofuranohydrolase